jgi:hypothetical protein
MRRRSGQGQTTRPLPPYPSRLQFEATASLHQIGSNPRFPADRLKRPTHQGANLDVLNALKVL